MNSRVQQRLSSEQLNCLQNISYTSLDALEFLRSLPSESIDAVIFDPPYSSGGLHKAQRALKTTSKYATQQNKYRPFTGDSMDQFSWQDWMRQVAAASAKALKPSGYFLSFIDWRQLPALSKAIQQGGILWRGVIAWDKTAAARAPHKGYFKHQAEYVLWGSKGDLPPAKHGGPWEGVISCRVNPKEKRHQTAKPVEVMKHLVQCVPPGGVVADPTAGSGATLVAAALSGRHALGNDFDAHYSQVFEQWREELLCEEVAA